MDADAKVSSPKPVNRSPVQAFEKSAMSKTIKRIHAEVTITLLENPPYGVEPDSYSSVKSFLQEGMDAACQSLYDEYRPFREYVSTDVMQLLTLCKAYRSAGQIVPPNWTKICEVELTAVDEKRPVSHPSPDYLRHFEERQAKQKTPSIGKEIVEMFIGVDLSDNDHEEEEQEPPNLASRKRRRTEDFVKEEPWEFESVAAKVKAILLEVCPEDHGPVKVGPSQIYREFVNFTKSTVKVEDWHEFSRESSLDTWFCLGCWFNDGTTSKDCRSHSHWLRRPWVKFLDAEGGRAQTIVTMDPSEL